MIDKELKLIVQPRVIDHLGIKMYQKPVDVISEFVANSWDADSEIVNIKLEKEKITISDNGSGMTFDECQDCYLTVGRDRREDTGKEISEERSRPILGRKGIGKFAGFGIAKTINIKTISKFNGEKTVFQMEIDSILEHDSRNENEKPIIVTEYIEPNEENKSLCGTTVTLDGLNVEITSQLVSDFSTELSRRFLLTQFYDDFKILVNDEKLPDNFNSEMEFVFPRDFTDAEKAKFPNVVSFENGWAKEPFQGKEIQWRIGFYEDTIKIEELRGLSIYAKGKLAQKPFFFDLTGGISGQNALEYMTGQIRMDFIDEGNNDLISTERQRINLQTELGRSIRTWGIEIIKILGLIWKTRRSEKRLQELNNKVSGFRDRLDKLPSSERKTIESVLKKIASFPRLGHPRFQELCNDILTSWEIGRLRNLITEISETKNLSAIKLLEIFSEADVLTALNIAESIKTKISTIGELKKRVMAKELENSVRNFIYDHPWLIHPKWESYKKERFVSKLISDIADKELNVEAFNGRVDLVLSSGENLLLIEFMRPGLPIDREHLERIFYYVDGIRKGLKKETGSRFKRIDSTYLITELKIDSDLFTTRIEQLSRDDNIFILSWDSLIEQAKNQWEEYLELIKQRNPNDKRIQDL
jgi:hypothetical protein